MVLLRISLMTSNAVYLFIYSGKVSNLFPFLICNFLVALFECFMILFIYLLWLCRAFCAVWVTCQLQCQGFPLRWLSLLRSTGSEALRLQQLWLIGSVVVVPRALEHRLSNCGTQLSCSLACGIFLDQGSNARLLHWQVDSLPVSCQRSPPSLNFKSSLYKSCISCMSTNIFSFCGQSFHFLLNTFQRIEAFTFAKAQCIHCFLVNHIFNTILQNPRSQKFSPTFYFTNFITLLCM